MLIKKSSLRKLIREALEGTPKDPAAVKGLKPTARYKEAIMITPSDADRLRKALRIASKFKNKPQYVWSGAASGGGGVSTRFYRVGDLSAGSGDPFTYESIGGDDYRVITGPLPETIGKVFELETAPSEPVKLPSATDVSASDSSPATRQPMDIMKMKLSDYIENYTPSKNRSIIRQYTSYVPWYSDKFTVQDWLAGKHNRKTLEALVTAVKIANSGGSQAEGTPGFVFTIIKDEIKRSGGDLENFDTRRVIELVNDEFTDLIDSGDPSTAILIE